MPNPTVFVLTHESHPNRRRMATSFIALAITRSVGRKGIPVVRVHPNHLDSSLQSRYVKAVELCPDFYDSEAALVDFLLNISPKYPEPRVLVPASDDCAYFLARHRDALATKYRIV